MKGRITIADGINQLNTAQNEDNSPGCEVQTNTSIGRTAARSIQLRQNFVPAIHFTLVGGSGVKGQDVQTK